MSQHKITVWLELWFKGEEKEAIVEFDYSPGRPGRWYLNNGDPGYPDEPAELEVTSIKIDGVSIDGLPEKELDRIEQACWDHIENERESREADAYDHWKASKETI